MQRRRGRAIAWVAAIVSIASAPSGWTQQPAVQPAQAQHAAEQPAPPPQQPAAQSAPAPQPALPAQVAQPAPPQQPALPPQPAPAPEPAQQPGAEEGFFRPREDPALTRLPDPVPAGAGILNDPAAALVIDAQTLEAVNRARDAEQRAREAAERDLDRAAREHREAPAAAPATRPIVISPLEGTAPITSPLDGSAPILSPIGR